MRRAISPVNTVNTPAVSSAATALAAGERRGWAITNVGATNVLYVLLGSGCTTGVYHFILKGGTGAADGLGGSISQTVGAVYQGIITVAGTSPSYVVLEMK